MWPLSSRLRPPPAPGTTAASCGRPAKSRPAGTKRLPAPVGAGSHRSGRAPSLVEPRGEQPLQLLLVARRVARHARRRVAGDELRASSPTTSSRAPRAASTTFSSSAERGSLTAYPPRMTATIGRAPLYARRRRPAPARPGRAHERESRIHKIRVVKPEDVIWEEACASPTRPRRPVRSSPRPLGRRQVQLRPLAARRAEPPLRAPVPRDRLHHRGPGRDHRRRRRGPDRRPGRHPHHPAGQQGLLEEPHAGEEGVGDLRRDRAPTSTPYIGPGGVLRTGAAARASARPLARLPAQRSAPGWRDAVRPRSSRTVTVTV